MTRSCRDIPLAKRFIRMIASGDAQKELFAGNHGQPGHLAAWHDRQQDARVGGAFSATLRTMENAWIRPRFAGYVAFQKNAGRALADHLKGDLTEEQLIRTFEREWLLIPPP
jgi:multiple sugar transport system substrate-binding protein